MLMPKLSSTMRAEVARGKMNPHTMTTVEEKHQVTAPFLGVDTNTEERPVLLAVSTQLFITTTL